MQRKTRYLLLSGASQESIEKCILDYIGILGWAKAAPICMPHATNKVILAINRSELENVKAALALASPPILLLKVSGTLKGFK